MTIQLQKDVHAQAISSIERYFRENRQEKIGNVGAGGLLGYFVEEIAPPAAAPARALDPAASHLLR